MVMALIPGHYLHWLVVNNGTHKKELWWNLNQNTNVSFKKMLLKCYWQHLGEFIQALSVLNVSIAALSTWPFRRCGSMCQSIQTHSMSKSMGLTKMGVVWYMSLRQPDSWKSHVHIDMKIMKNYADMFVAYGASSVQLWMTEVSLTIVFQFTIFA